MSGRDLGRRLLEGAAIASPLVIGLLSPARALPGPLAFVLSNGWWLAAAGIAATMLAVALPGRRLPPRATTTIAEVLRGRRARPLLFAAAFLVAVGSLPRWRLFGPGSGDEPKYLRIARSLRCDLDSDVSSDREGPLGAAELAQNAGRLARSTLDATVSLLRAEHPPADHAWNLGNWTIRGWHGGDYHVHGPALPLLLAPLVGSEWDGPTVPRAALTLMAALFALAFANTALLAADLSGSRPAGALAAAVVVLSPAVFVNGYHVYPDAVVVALVPWIARHAWSGGPPLRPVRLSLLGLAAGALVWLHIKFLPLGVVCAVLLARRVGRRRSLVLLAVAVFTPMFAWTLYQHRLTGLVRPDALYVRVADAAVWRGVPTGVPWLFISGLGNGLFGARDGLFVMVPAAWIAALGVPWLWRRDRDATLVLGALFAGIWLAMALHGGAAAGPPARLLSSATPLLAAPLAVGMRELGRLRAFRWSVAAAVIVSLVAVATMGSNWRRTANPYRGLVGEVELRRDLPGRHDDATAASLDLARAALLLSVVGFWAWRFRRLAETSASDSAGETPSRTRVWREAVALQIGAWITLVVSSVALRGLSALAGG